MSLTTEVRKLADTVTTQYAKQLYIAAGATDLAVERVRTFPNQAKELQGKVAELASVEVPQLPVKARAYAESLNDRTTAFVQDLTVRGEVLVKRIRRQESTERAEQAARATATRARATRKAATSTATETAHAVEDAAAKIG